MVMEVVAGSAKAAMRSETDMGYTVYFFYRLRKKAILTIYQYFIAQGTVGALN
jgi:hypothetical protein